MVESIPHFYRDKTFMAKHSKRTNPIVLKAGMSIGANAAESDDEFLLPCFIHYPPVEQCFSVHSRGMVIDGRTGSGKTAILKYIESQTPQTTTIDPFDMAMSYVSNSDVLNFLQAIGADLELMFQVLWKHVLCIEFIRMRFGVNNEDLSRSTFQWIADQFRQDSRKERAIKYLRNWQGRFWITMDQNIKELTEKVENAVKLELGAEVEKFKLGGQYDKRLSVDKKSEFIARVRKIISSDQLAELGSVIEMLAEVERSEAMKSYYILIDRLDENWVDVSVRFKLIRALVESLKSFRKIRDLKVLVAIRSDILERVVQETRDLTFQREKLDDYFVHIKWNKQLLKELVDRRIQSLFRKQYSGGDITFEDVFPYSVGNIEPFDYIIARTLMRPRDMIAFVNECLEAAEGTYQVTATTIKKAEIQFSRIRREALEQEWQSAYPTIKKLLDVIGSKGKSLFPMSELCPGAEGENLALEFYGNPKIDFDPIYEAAKAYCDGANPTIFVKTIVSILYRVGALGVKLKAGERFTFAHTDQPLLPITQIPDELPLRVHPMLWGTFRIQ